MTLSAVRDEERGVGAADALSRLHRLRQIRLHLLAQEPGRISRRLLEQVEIGLLPFCPSQAFYGRNLWIFVIS